MQETLTQSEVAALLRGEHVKRKPAKQPTQRARGRLNHQPGVMNKLEAKYANELKTLQYTGAIEWWAFEPIKLKLADRTFYTPDFCVMHIDGSIEFVETKGFWHDDARVKIKVAAATFPMFKFIALQPLAKKHGGEWKREEF